VTTAVVGELTTLDRQGITREYELQVRRRILGAETLGGAVGAGEATGERDESFYESEHFDERRFARPRRRRERDGSGRRDDDRDVPDERENHDDDFWYLAGVGGAMTDEDEHAEVVGELDAGQISVPVMEEDADGRGAPEDDEAMPPDDRPSDLR
jgi:hypothetical protein